MNVISLNSTGFADKKLTFKNSDIIESISRGSLSDLKKVLRYFIQLEGIDAVHEYLEMNACICLAVPHARMLRFLLGELGLDPDTVDANGMVSSKWLFDNLEWSMILAVKGGYELSVEALIDHGASVDFIIDGDTAVHTVARSGHVGILKLLLNASAKSSVQNSSGFTPLSILILSWVTEVVACMSGATECIKYLLRCSGDPFLKVDGLSAFDFCLERENVCNAVLILQSEREYMLSKGREACDCEMYHNYAYDFFHETQASNTFTRQFYDISGFSIKSKMQSVTSNIQDGWSCVGEWRISKDSGSEWMYSQDLTHPDSMWTPTPIQTLLGKLFRRRMHFQVKKREILTHLVPFAETPKYLETALVLAAAIPTHSINETREELESIRSAYEDIIASLLEQIRAESDALITDLVKEYVDRLLATLEDVCVMCERVRKGKMPLRLPILTNDTVPFYSSRLEVVPDVNLRPEKVWVSDSCCVNCVGCRSVFTIFNRRHHCRYESKVSL